MNEQLYVKKGKRYVPIKTRFPEEGIWMVLNRNEGEVKVLKLSEIPDNPYINFEFLSHAGDLASFIYHWCKDNMGYSVIELSSAICNFFASKQKQTLENTKDLIR